MTREKTAAPLWLRNATCILRTERTGGAEGMEVGFAACALLIRPQFDGDSMGSPWQWGSIVPAPKESPTIRRVTHTGSLWGLPSKPGMEVESWRGGAGAEPLGFHLHSHFLRIFQAVTNICIAFAPGFRSRAQSRYASR